MVSFLCATAIMLDTKLLGLLGKSVLVVALKHNLAAPQWLAFRTTRRLVCGFTGGSSVGHMSPTASQPALHSPLPAWSQMQDARANWICNPVHKHRELRGLTSAGKSYRGLRTKGTGANKARPSRRASYKRRNAVTFRRFR
jgi:hypothetical protein